MSSHKRATAATAETFLTRGQLLTLGVIIAVVPTVWAFTDGFRVAQFLLVTVVAGYTLFSALKLAAWIAGARSTLPNLQLPSVDDPDLPTYTILVPLYQEVEVFPRLVAALGELHYPTERLQVLLLLEERDTAMVDAVSSASLPKHFTPVIVPDVGPQTKPKACDYGMTFATGEYTVIFDAEDRPEADHLLKAVASARLERSKDPRVVCMQAILRFWNPRSGPPSAFYWAEYIAHFEWMLVGMRRLGLIPPLGGTSNHFLTSALWEVADRYGQLEFRHGGQQVTIPNIWDPFNVTEDADLAARLARLGYRIGLFSAVTLEEAPHRLGVALRQRTRWLQGYLVTGLVHTRNPIRSARELGPLRYLAFNAFMLGTPISLALNPLVWTLTIYLLLAQVLPGVPGAEFTNGLFPPAVSYVGIALMVVGNLLFFAQNILAALRRTDGDEAGLAKWMLLTPLWWAFTSLSAYRGLWRLLTARSQWEKTPHGHDQELEQLVLGKPEPTPASVQAAA
ncbi:glycosyltransferase family 2 protein [Saccharomonospora sp. NPDC046836]|uniref:glycosyltransferase family 2 protein n=1 Tax=Saccharomonospora sp. NPDC046836 TaxID=3156921 RepID=UPI0033D4A558